MRLQKSCKGRIRRQIGLVPHQRGVHPHHPTHGRRQTLEDVLEVRAGFPRILLVGDQNLSFGRLGGLLGWSGRTLRRVRKWRIGEQQDQHDNRNAQTGQGIQHL